MTTIGTRIRERWKVLAVLGGIWLAVMFPIPFLPLFGAPYDETSVRTLLMITSIVSIPFTLLALFMNDGSNISRAKRENGTPGMNGGLS